MSALNPRQFVRTSELVQWADPDVDEGWEHVDRVDKLVDSMREHGYVEGMADHPIEVLRGEKSSLVLEGQHRVWAAHHAGIEELPVEEHR